jgi:hypothetical protein
MPRYAKITRPGEGCYVQPLALLPLAMEGELDGAGDWPVGERVEVEIIEMSEADYTKLPEFEGW